LFPSVLASFAYAAEWVEQAFGIVKDLAGGSTSDTEKTSAIGVVRITFEGYEFVVFDFNGHAALGRLAVHGTHGGDLAFAGHRFFSFMVMQIFVLYTFLLFVGKFGVGIG